MKEELEKETARSQSAEGVVQHMLWVSDYKTREIFGKVSDSSSTTKTRSL